MSFSFAPGLVNNPSLTGFVTACLKRYWRWAVTIAVLRCAALATNIAWPLFNKYMIDYLFLFQLSGQVDWHIVTLLMLMGFAAWYGTDVPEIAARIISGPVIAKMRADMRLLVLEDLYRQSQQFFHDRFVGAISTSLRDISEIVTDIANDIVWNYIPSALLLISLGYILFDLHYSYLILILVWTGIQIAIVYRAQRAAQGKSSVYAQYRSELFGKVIDSLSNHLTVRSFGARQEEHTHIIQAENIVVDARVAAVRYTQGIELIKASSEVLFLFVIAISIYLYLFQKGEATPGDFMLVISGLWNLMKPIKDISERIMWLYEQSGVAKEAIRKIIVPNQIKDKDHARDLVIQEATIKVQNLEFSYHAGKPVLQNLNLEIKGGLKVGLVGYSGAGKTTFAQLLMRFYDPAHGAILIDGQDIADVTQESLRRAIGLIPQDISLFNRTLRENIAIARPGALDEDIIQATTLAGAHDFIMGLPRQYDTMVGERGIKLSGGQRQRIAIARAFLKAAPVLILDEATSALDSMTERDIQDALDKVMAGRTTIVIAHRLSTLRRMDRILVFDHGRIVEDGSHDALLAQNGIYGRMWAMQAGGFLPEEDPETREESVSPLPDLA